jgi:hypothetical protein
MDRNTNKLETTIPQGRTLRIQDGKGVELEVVAGCLWITQDEDTDDKVVEAGESFHVSRNGLTLAHAAKEVRVRIASEAQAGMPVLTLGGGYREYGASVVRSVFAEWTRGMRERSAGRARVPQPAASA